MTNANETKARYTVQPETQTIGIDVTGRETRIGKRVSEKDITLYVVYREGERVPAASFRTEAEALAWIAWLESAASAPHPGAAEGE